MLTPDELVDYPLKQTMRGYSVAQVDELLDRVADSLERLHARVADLEQQLATCEQRLASAAETEGTLKRTLVTAQRAAEQALDEARERAAKVVDDAEQKARDRLLDAERRRRRLEDHIAELRDFEEAYRAELREALQDRLRQLERIGTTVAPLDDDIPPEVADLLAMPSDDDRPPLTVRVHDETDGAPTDGDEFDDRPLAWPPSGRERDVPGADRDRPDPDRSGE